MRSRPWFWRLSMLLLLLILVIGILLLQAAENNRLSALRAELGSLQTIGTAVRATLIVVLVAAWPRLVEFVLQRGYVESSAGELLQRSRWRAAAWLIAAEFLIGGSATAHAVTTVVVPRP